MVLSSCLAYHCILSQRKKTQFAYFFPIVYQFIIFLPIAGDDSQQDACSSVFNMHGHIFYIIKGTRRFLTRLKKWQPVKKYCNHYAFVISLCICLLNCHSVHSSAKNCIRIFGFELLCTRINLVCLCFF